VSASANQALADLYRTEVGQLTASITRFTGDLQLAEDVIQEAFFKAADRWSAEAPPPHAAAWLMTTARNAALDHMRRTKTWNNRLQDIALMEELQRPTTTTPDYEEPAPLHDDLLRLIFTCCHPAIHMDARVALCLNTVCGMTTREIASAFIVPDATMSQRLWRAKNKIRDAGIAYRVPDAEELQERLHAVLAVVYLIFNEGWLASSGEQGQRLDLTNEAIRLARLLRSLLPAESEVQALLALMLIQHSRREARFDDHGSLILLGEQDRSLWDTQNIVEGAELVRKVYAAGKGYSRYAIMAAIACVHATASTSDQTDWAEIAQLYEHLMDLDPSAVVALNHAVALGERDGPAAGLQRLLALEESPTMQRYHLYHSAKADLLRRLERPAEAKAAYDAALALANNGVERAFLQQRINQVSNLLQ